MSSETRIRQQSDTRAVELRAKLFRGLADISRLSILAALRDGSLSVGEIVSATGLSQSNASNHLRCLSECGLVIGEPDGRFVRYRSSDPRLDELMRLADELLAGTARGVDPCENFKGTDIL
jgi:DNA-binding transcriptional ArsR family regulator